MKFFRSYDGVDFGSIAAAFADFDDYAPLHEIRKGKLALLLIQARALYDLKRSREKTVAPGTSATEIRNILGSISRIADFARKAQSEDHPASADAMLRIVGMAALWAERNQRDLPSFFRKTIYPSDEGERVDFGAAGVMAAFFAAAPVIYEIADRAERSMAEFKREDEPMSAIVWLAGRRLPDIYGNLFRAKVTTTRGGNHGIEFVQTALKAIKVRNSISDETIISHLKMARGVKAAETS